MTDRPWLRVYDEGVPRTIAYPDVALPKSLIGKVLGRQLADEDCATRQTVG